jgi:hypothetical protein
MMMMMNEDDVMMMMNEDDVMMMMNEDDVMKNNLMNDNNGQC